MEENIYNIRYKFGNTELVLDKYLAERLGAWLVILKQLTTLASWEIPLEEDYGCVQLTYSLTNTGPEHMGPYYHNHCGARIFRAGVHGINTFP